MLIKCSNFCCSNIVDTDKICHLYYPLGFEQTLTFMFCSNECEMFQRFLDDPRKRKYIKKYDIRYKKFIEKNFRHLYDFMPESFFYFFKEKEIKNDFGVQYDYE